MEKNPEIFFEGLLEDLSLEVRQDTWTHDDSPLFCKNNRGIESGL